MSLMSRFEVKVAWWDEYSTCKGSFGFNLMRFGEHWFLGLPGARCMDAGEIMASSQKR